MSKSEVVAVIGGGGGGVMRGVIGHMISLTT